MLPYAPLQVILITCRGHSSHFGKEEEMEDIFPLTWHTPVSQSPEMYAIAVSKKMTASLEMIRSSNVFCVNFMPFDLKDKIIKASKFFAKHDEFKELGFGKEECEKIDCPRIKEALGFLECEVANEIEAGDHALFIGKVVNSHLE